MRFRGADMGAGGLRQQTGMEPLHFKRRYEQKAKRLRAVIMFYGAADFGCEPRHMDGGKWRENEFRGNDKAAVWDG